MRALVVDDSTVFRKVVRDSLEELPEVEVVGIAADGMAALQKIDQLTPDLVTLDLEMPVLNGLDVLRQLQTREASPDVIMLSAMTDRSASATTQALRLGAFDFVLKPAHASLEENSAQLRRDLLPKVKALIQRHVSIPAAAADPSDHLCGATPYDPFRGSSNRIRAIGIGISTGGPAALTRMLPKLPGDFPVPLLVVQHMPPVFTLSLASELNRTCQITVCEASHGQVIEQAFVYIAPGGKQMRVGREFGREVIQITDDPPERNCKPSVDYLFRSMAHTYGSDSMAVVMTGMGDDGALGCQLMKRNGCGIVAQDEASCVVFGMPRQVIEAGLADTVSSLDHIHEVIMRTAIRGAAVCR